MEQGQEQEPITISVTPEPTEEETAAIAAVVTAIVTAAVRRPTARSRDGDRWQLAAREEALRAPEWHVEAVQRDA
jgi:hypothetical protein